MLCSLRPSTRTTCTRGRTRPRPSKTSTARWRRNMALPARLTTGSESASLRTDPKQRHGRRLRQPSYTSQAGGVWAPGAAVAKRPHLHGARSRVPSASWPWRPALGSFVVTYVGLGTFRVAVRPPENRSHGYPAPPGTSQFTWFSSRKRNGCISRTGGFRHRGARAGRVLGGARRGPC